MFHFHSVLLLTRWLLVFCFIGSLSFSAGAATITVTNIDDSGVGSLRDKITNASAGDTISFDSVLAGQTITLASQIIIDKSLTIDGSGAPGLIISGNNLWRVFYVNSGIEVTLSDLTIKKGKADYGAGVYNAGDLTVTNCMIQDNASTSSSHGGGGIKNTGTLSVKNSTFSNNTATGIGGAIFNDGSTTAAVATLESSTFDQNTASTKGGGIYNHSNSSLTITNSTFSANRASNYYGGGIFNAGTSGALSVGVLSIIHSTFSENYAKEQGGGIYNDGYLEIANTIVSANSVDSGGYGPEIFNGTYNGGYTFSPSGNNVFGFAGGIGISINTSIFTGDCYCISPSSTLLLSDIIGALQNNGGSTLTRAPVISGLAHNAGDNALAAGLSFDQRGEPFSRIVDSTVDIGAVEINSVSSFDLTVNITGSGTVTSESGEINCSSNCYASINSGTTVILTATETSDSVFVGWSDSVCSGTGSCTVRMDAVKTVTANFAITQKTLSISKVGNGRVFTDDNAINCGETCSNNFNYGTNVTLKTSADAGYVFNGWNVCTGSDSCTVTMDGNKHVTATFTAITYPIAITIAPTGSGTVNCTNNPVAYGGNSICTAVNNSGYTFNGFSDDCVGSTCEFKNVTSNKAVTANFTLNTYSITATANPTAGGTVNCSPNPVVYGGMSECTVTTNTGYTFNGFSDDCSGTTCELTNVTANKTVTANFIAIPIALTVTSAGTGVGTITSVPAGINCSTNCTANFASGSEIILNATAATGSTFTGWSGGICSGTSACTLHLSAAQTVIATFRHSAATLGLNDTGINTCGNANTNRLSCPVAGFPRQDAEYGTNQFDFTKLDLSGNELAATATNHACVRDNVTGLIWEIKTKDGGSRDHKSLYSWTERLAYVEKVNAAHLCGFNDWRVPDIKELTGIVSYQHVIPKPAIVTSYFSDLDKIGTLGFWSEATSSDIASSAWFLYFTNGAANYGKHNKKYHLRLVRGVPAKNVLVDNANGTISQTNTGLIWAKCSEGQTGDTCAGTATIMTWEQALVTASNSNLGNYSDWRLPNIKELQTLIEYERDGAAKLNSNYFPNTPTTAFWSSTPFALYARNAWYLYPNGYLGSLARTKTLHVRLVRNQ